MRALAAYCRTLPGVSEDVKWGDDLVFSVHGRMFCIFSLEGGKLVRLSFKVDDHRFLEHTDRPQFIPAPYLARAHWVSVVERKGLPPAELKAMIARSHALVLARLPRKTQAAVLAKGVTTKRAAPKGHGDKVTIRFRSRPVHHRTKAG